MTERVVMSEVDAFTTGAIGQPGQRTFYVQARAGRRAVSVKCEKQQVALLGQYLQGMLADLPPASDQPLPSSLELREPVEATFVLGGFALGIDHENDRVVLQLEEVREQSEDDEESGEVEEDEDDESRSMLRVALTRGQVDAFCRHAVDVVAAGRPSCRWCGRPIDPDGHACPRMN
jgi:uncharacterized repeat protein (TIGR03847 family)